MTFGTWRWWGRHSHASAAFTPRNVPGTHIYIHTHTHTRARARARARIAKTPKETQKSAVHYCAYSVSCSANPNPWTARVVYTRGLVTKVQMSNTSLITPTKSTIFIHYLYLLCFLHNHQGELWSSLFKVNRTQILGLYDRASRQIVWPCIATDFMAVHRDRLYERASWQIVWPCIVTDLWACIVTGCMTVHRDRFLVNKTNRCTEF
jgi:hypothetical protein